MQPRQSEESQRENLGDLLQQRQNMIIYQLIKYLINNLSQIAVFRTFTLLLILGIIIEVLFLIRQLFALRPHSKQNFNLQIPTCRHTIHLHNILFLNILLRKVELLFQLFLNQIRIMELFSLNLNFLHLSNLVIKRLQLLHQFHLHTIEQLHS